MRIPYYLKRSFHKVDVPVFRHYSSSIDTISTEDFYKAYISLADCTGETGLFAGLIRKYALIPGLNWYTEKNLEKSEGLITSAGEKRFVSINRRTALRTIDES